ncbi:hypothetical protein SAMN05421819_2646 [Bryocella elongata]|uniref:DUF1684 domain-containing protein n=2 Tax=Bryocella elongata TaxID=863522 RepID=A0A1H5ZGZ0_9BACT|nr:hypothetical protein SAMN05421819_2646 [Bryocella elongata]
MRVAALAAVLAVAGSSASAAGPDDKASYNASQEQWRANRAKSLQAPEGWLSLVGLEWLKAGSNAVGSAPESTAHLPAGAPAHLAVIEQTEKVPGASLKIDAPKGGFPAGFTIDGKPAVAGPLSLDSKLQFGSFVVTIIPRGELLGLRIKDANAPERVNFRGLNWYAPNVAYRVQAKWIPYQRAHEVAIATVIGTTLHEKVPGAAEFQLNGKTLRLEPVVEGKKLFFILRDLTSRTTTYGASRFLYTDFPTQGLDKAGAVTLDFNQLQNPPCAYTNFATCPLPPQQNKLQVAIPVGEKRFHDE